MKIDSDALYVELRELCKREGVRDSAVLERMGEQLRRVCGISDRDTHATARLKLRAWVDRMTQDYTAERKKILKVVFGLYSQAHHSTLGRREDWLAGQMYCGRRTVQRWADEALGQLAHDAAAEARASVAADEVGYVVRKLEAVLRLDLDHPEATELHQIEVTHDALDVILRQLSVPHGAEPGRDFWCEVVEGGELLSIGRQPGNLDLIAARIRPPERLLKGRRHSYKIKYEFRPDQPVANHYVVLPFTPYDMAKLTVCFSRTRLPSKVWKLDGVSPWQLEYPDTVGELLPPNESGTYELSFNGFLSGRAYGFGWAWQ